MFNTIINHQKEFVPYTKNVEIKENRAPTDESLALLKEMEEKVLKKITQSFATDNNIFSASMSLVESEAIFKSQLLVKFQLNGKDYVFIQDLNRFKNIEENIKLFTTRLSEFIAKNIIEKLVDQKEQSIFDFMRKFDKK